MLQNVATGYGIISHTRQTHYCVFVIFRVVISISDRHFDHHFTSMDQSMCHGGSHPATISELVDASSVYNLGRVDSSSQGPDHGN